MNTGMGIGSYGSPYGQSYNPYGGVGGGYGMNSFSTGMYPGSQFGYNTGMPPYGNSNFFRIAEEGGRGALQSVETVVRWYIYQIFIIELCVQYIMPTNCVRTLLFTS